MMNIVYRKIDDKNIINRINNFPKYGRFYTKNRNSIGFNYQKRDELRHIIVKVFEINDDNDTFP